MPNQSSAARMWPPVGTATTCMPFLSRDVVSSSRISRSSSMMRMWPAVFAWMAQAVQTEGVANSRPTIALANR